MTIATHQSIRAGQNTPTAATHNPAWATAYDCGNGSVKLIINHAEIRIPSYIQPILFPLRDVPATGFVEYLEGDRADLISRKWVGGISAYHLNPTTLTRVVDSRSSKIELGLQLLLSALTELPHRDQWHFALIASIRPLAKVHFLNEFLTVSASHSVTYARSLFMTLKPWERKWARH